MKISVWRVLVASLCMVLLAGGPTLAHTDLVKSDPVGGATLDQVPNGIRLEFEEPVEARFDPVDVYDEEGNRVDLEDAGISPGDSRVVTAGLAGLRGGETYRVEYRVIARDGDPTEGAYTFTTANEARASESGGGENIDAAPGDEQAGSSRIPLYAGLGIAGLLALALVLERRGRGGVAE